MNFEDFAIFVAPFLVVFISVAFIFLWGAYGKHKEK